MKNLRTLLLLLIIITGNYMGCAQQNNNTMTIEELKTEMKTNDSLIILDVRTPQELAGPLGQIDGVINIPVQELEARLDEIESYKDKEIAVICRTGNRSGVAVEILEENGFKAKNVLGGMMEYRE